MQGYNQTLSHYGVKGMKWGVRKKTDKLNSRDRTIKAGTELQRMMQTEKYNNNGRRQYVSYTHHDNARYAGVTGLGWDKAYMHKFTVKKDIKIPSDRKVADALTKIAREDPQRMANDLYNASRACSFLKGNQKHWNKNVKALTKGKESKKRYRAANEFVQLAMQDKELGRSWSKLSEMMVKQGYDALSDSADRERSSQDPLVMLNMSKAKHTKSVRVTPQEASAYLQDYMSAKTRREYKKTTGIQR